MSYRNVLAAASAALFLFPSSKPASAGDDFWHQQRQTSVGVYFHMPFGGTVRQRREAQFQYGFALSLNQHYFGADGARLEPFGFKADLVKLKFGPDGFDNFAISGRNIIEYHTTLRADGGTEKKGGINWVWVGVGAVAVVGAVTAATASAVDCLLCDDNKSQ